MIIQKFTHKAFNLKIKVTSPRSCLNSTLEVVRISGPRFIGPKIVSGTWSAIRVYRYWIKLPFLNKVTVFG